MINRFSIIEQENKQLEQEIAILLAQSRSEDVKSSTEETINKTDQPQQQRTGHRRIPGLSFIVLNYLYNLDFH